MTDALKGLYGAGGCARGLMPLLARSHPDGPTVFVEDEPRAESLNGHPIMRFADFSSRPGARVAIAVAAPAVRRQLAAKCAASGLAFYSLRADDLVVMDDVVWGEGGLFSPRCTLTSNIRIGAHFHCNLHSYVEHDCTIGDFVTFAPGVRCNGNVTIGDEAYIGSGAMIRQGITIGAAAIVGMGAVVVKDVAPGETVAGNPARRL